MFLGGQPGGADGGRGCGPGAQWPTGFEVWAGAATQWGKRCIVVLQVGLTQRPAPPPASAQMEAAAADTFFSQRQLID